MARSNLQIKVGKYTGNGVDSTNITTVGFRPRFLMIKGNGAGVWRTQIMPRDVTNYLATTTSGQADIIQEFLANGFQVGTSLRVNTNATTYYYVALNWNSAQAYARNGLYIGDGNDSRNITTTGINFTPDFLMLQSSTSTTSSVVYRTAEMSGDVSGKFDGATVTNLLQNFQSNGFQVGTAAGVNTSSLPYYFTALKKLPGILQTGTLTGSGIAQSITGLGFTPDLVIVKNGATSDQARFLTSTMITDGATSQYFGTTATDANGITSLNSDGFNIGTSASVNGSGNAIYWIAMKAGDFNAPLVRNTA